MSKNNLAINYGELDNISYDSKEMVKEIACCIEFDEQIIGNGSKYSKQDRIKALAVYIVVGKVKPTSAIVGIPERTIHTWSKSEWWIDAKAKVSKINDQIIDSRTTKIINLAFDNVENRLKTGEYATYDTDLKEIVYKPVSAKDSATIFGIMFDKRQISRALPTSINQTTTHHLLDIKAQFESMTNKPAIDVDTVERIE